MLVCLCVYHLYYVLMDISDYKSLYEYLIIPQYIVPGLEFWDMGTLQSLNIYILLNDFSVTE